MALETRTRIETLEPPAVGPRGGVVRAMRSLFARRRSAEGLTPYPAPAGSDYDIEVAAPRSRFSLALWSFVGLVVVPAMAISAYFAVIASDIYVSDASLAVRTIAAEPMSGKLDQAMAAISSPTSISSASQDAFIVTSYIGSRAILDDLKPTVNLRELFRRPGADFWARLGDNATQEDLYDYWRKMVRTYIDGPSGIVNLQVRAFTAADAQFLASEIIRLSEALANRVSDRARKDALVQAEAEVNRANAILKDALDALQAYRNTEGFIDPVKVADQTAKLLLSLMGEKIQLESQIYVGIRTMGPDSPTLKGSQTRLQAIDEQIAKLRAKLAGKGGAENIAASLVRFEELMVRKQYGQTLYEFARAGYERARIAASRQGIYVTVFVPPSNPDEALLPKRFGYSLIWTIALLVMWSIAALILASIEDHRM